MNRIRGLLCRVEDTANFLFLSVLALLPVVEIIARRFFNSGIPSSANYVYHLVFLLTFLGGSYTARKGDHLAIMAGVELLSGKPRVQKWVKSISAHLALAVTTVFFLSSLSFLFLAFDSSVKVGFIPAQYFVACMPLGFLLIAWRFFLLSPAGVKHKTVSAFGLLTGLVLGYSALYNMLFFFFPGLPFLFDDILSFWYIFVGPFSLLLILLLIGGAFFGTPLFIVLGGLGVLLFARSGGALEAVPNEAYSMLISETIPVIPLFTFAGFILSQSRAGERLVALFRGLFGWIPGGQIIAAVLVSTFFTTFTGASGVTILALGGVLYVVLHKEGPFGDDFTTGFLTASGSVGFLFPPSLPIILYGVVAQISIVDMFIGGLIPGLIVMVAMMLIGIVVASRNKVKPIPFNAGEVVKGLKSSIWELLLPLLIIVLYFSGTASLIETASFSVVYIFFVEVVIQREVKSRELFSIALKAMPIIGGVLIILAVSRGLSYYIIDADIPIRLTEWIEAHIQSKLLFLVLLNIALIITGCFMDIFSAIMVVAPLIIPIGEVFGIHPVHLGIIFLANLELGFMTPPVGLNLFLGSYRFGKPLTRIYRNIVPFFLLQLGALLIITYVPAFTTFLLNLINL
ncbi:MAG: TRAP transporter large permease subunit [Spirochaetaceae bacterium]